MSKLMIVDDSADLLEAMEIILLQRGYTIKTLPGWHNIFYEIKDFNPDLVILDIFLSGKDGRELCKELRKVVENKYLCIMMFSASPRALEDFAAYGADGFLEKPFGINDLVEKIESLLKNCKDKPA